VRVDAPFNLRASDGRVLIMPGGGEVYWYGVAKKVRSRGRAANGVVRAKPSDWHDTKPGKSYDSRPVKIDPSVFYRCWHPAQLWLQVERLKGFYLTAEVGGPRFKALTDELFRWQGMINPLVSDTAVEAAAGDPPLLAPAVKTEFMGPLAKLNDMVNTCILGLDYFGNERDFAPNVTFAYYERALKESLARLEKFEAVYFAFLKKAKEQADLKNAVSEVFEQSVAIVSTAQEQLAKVRLELEQAEALIKARSKIVSQLRSELLKPSGDLDEFKKNIQGFKCDLEAILSGLEMMVFVPPTQTNLEGVTELSGVGVAMAGVQVAKFIQHGLTTIKASDGKEFETENVISSITELEDSVWATAQSAYNDAKGKKIDVGGPRILATLDKLDKLVSQFAGKTSASKLRYDISALVSAVRQRANAIVEFNLKLMRALMLQQIIADADAARVGALKKAADWNDPALPEMLGFLARQYQHMKDAAIERVYLANRAAAFWMLDDGSPHVVDGKVVGGFNVFRDTLEEKAPGWRDVDVYGAIGWNVLSACEARLQDAFDHGIAAHSGVAQVFGSKDAAGDKIIITDEGVLAAFKEGRDGVNQVNIRISRDGAPGTFTGDHLKNYANAHLTTFRVFLNGAFRKEGGNDQFIYIKFKHDSRDEYYNEKEALRTFSRVDLDPGTFAYDGAKGALRYEIDPDTKRETSRFKGGYIHIEGDLGTGGTPQELARDDQHAIYAGVGPFTEWTIVLVPSAKGKVDLSGLSSIEIQLVGIFRTSKASPAATSSTAPILTVEEHQP
jgi:hypothetical protein